MKNRYSALTNDNFRSRLEDYVASIQGNVLLNIPRVYEAVSEFFNNEILKDFESDRLTYIFNKGIFSGNDSTEGVVIVFKNEITLEELQDWIADESFKEELEDIAGDYSKNIEDDFDLDNIELTLLVDHVRLVLPYKSIS